MAAAFGRLTPGLWSCREEPNDLPRAGRIRLLPAEFAKPAVVNAEMVSNLVDDSTADLVGDLLLGAADRADRLAVDGDAVGQDMGGS